MKEHHHEQDEAIGGILRLLHESRVDHAAQGDHAAQAEKQAKQMERLCHDISAEVKQQLAAAVLALSQPAQGRRRFMERVRLQAD